MKIKLKYKLFLFILAISLVIVLGIFAISRVTFRYQFLNYIEMRETKKLKRIAALIAENYPDKKNLDFIAENPFILFRLSRELRPDLKRGGKLLRQHPPDFDKRRFSKGPPPRPFSMRKPPVLILDADKKPIVGFLHHDLRLKSVPVTIGERRIGWIGFYPERHIRLEDERRFLYNQYQTFLIISAGMVFLSIMVAIWASYYLEKPIKVIAKGARKLAQGKFDIKLPVNSNDELGDLARNFNFLGETLLKNEGDRKKWVEDIAHELRTPLTLLRGELEAVEDGVRPLDSGTVKYLKSDINLLIRLVTDLNELSKTDLGSVSYRKEDIKPVEILKRVIGKFSDEIEKKEFNISINFKAENQKIFGDNDRIDQLFSNIIKNSIDYTEDKGTIAFKSEVTDGKLKIKVDDSAPSVPEKDLTKLFDRLYRVESSRNRVYGGSGLGLAICENIVKAHGGHIEASGSYLGGLSVTITFPV